MNRTARLLLAGEIVSGIVLNLTDHAHCISSLAYFKQEGWHRALFAAKSLYRIDVHRTTRRDQRRNQGN